MKLFCPKNFLQIVHNYLSCSGYWSNFSHMNCAGRTRQAQFAECLVKSVFSAKKKRNTRLMFPCLPGRSVIKNLFKEKKLSSFFFSFIERVFLLFESESLFSMGIRLQLGTSKWNPQADTEKRGRKKWVCSKWKRRRRLKHRSLQKQMRSREGDMRRKAWGRRRPTGT